MEGGPAEITASYCRAAATARTTACRPSIPASMRSASACFLMNGSIFMGWTSHCDEDPYTGWLMMYNETTLQQTSVSLTLTPNGSSTPHYDNGEGKSICSKQAPDLLRSDTQGNIYFLDAKRLLPDTTMNSSGFPRQGQFRQCILESFDGKQQALCRQIDAFNTWNTVRSVDQRPRPRIRRRPAFCPTRDRCLAGATRHLAVWSRQGRQYLRGRSRQLWANSAHHRTTSTSSSRTCSQVSSGWPPGSTTPSTTAASTASCRRFHPAVRETGNYTLQPDLHILYISRYDARHNRERHAECASAWAVENASPAVLHAGTTLGIWLPNSTTVIRQPTDAT